MNLVDGWDGATHQSLVRNGLHKAIQDLGERARADPRPPHRIRIATHTPLPVLADRLQRRQPRLRPAPVVDKVFGAHGDLGRAHGRHFLRLAVHVCTDCRPETVDDVHAE